MNLELVLPLPIIFEHLATSTGVIPHNATIRCFVAKEPHILFANASTPRLSWRNAFGVQLAVSTRDRHLRHDRILGYSDRTLGFNICHTKLIERCEWQSLS
jgi:hypothetical protein